MEVSVLGPVALRDDGREVSLAPRLRSLLAALLCHRGRIVSTDLLVDVLWGEHSPAAAPRSLQVYVHRLRTALGDAHHIEHRRPGYRLVVDDGRVDADRFERLVERGRECLAAGDAAAGVDLFREALALWNGAAFDGCGEAGGVREEAERLTELRHTCTEECLRAEIELGRHAEVVGELRGLVAVHPYREGLRGLLMLALYRLGRPTEALDAYRAGRTLLADELGLEPGQELRDLESAILNQDPSLDLDAPARVMSAVVPRELPPDVTAFTGRGDRLDRLAASLIAGDGAGPPIAAIDGAAGVGKSALAIRVAHRVAVAYPDGQLYVNLHGHTAGTDPLTPADVLDRFLRALGDAAQHTDTEEAAARFRSLTAERRVLVVLDNAVDEAQVRPLLPAGPGCGVLVTSRRVLGVLDGAVHEHLDALAPDDAVALLGRLVGDDRAGAEADAAAEIARLCGNWPLALRIAAARLVVRHDLTLAAYAGRLAEDRGRLDELQHGDLAVRASLAAGHRNSPDEARMLAVLGVFNGHTVTAPVAAAAAGTSTTAAAHDLEHLAESQLLQPVAPDRFEMHDLVRAYAREQAEILLTPKEYDAALERVLHFYLATARRVTMTVDPGTAFRTTIGASSSDEVGIVPEDRTTAIAWVQAERANLILALRQAAASDAYAPIAAGLAAALYRPMDMLSARREQFTVNEEALAAAIRVGDPRCQAQATNDLATVNALTGRDEAALALHARAIELWRAAGDPTGEAKSFTNLGVAHLVAGHFTEAADCYHRSLALRRDLGDRAGEALILDNLGNVYRKMGAFEEALAYGHRGLALHEAAGHIRGQAIAKGNLAEAYRRLDRLSEAEELFRDAIDLSHESGDGLAAAEFLWELGDTLHAMGRAGDARVRWTESIAELREIGAIDADEAASVLAEPEPTMPQVLRLHA